MTAQATTNPVPWIPALRQADLLRRLGKAGYQVHATVNGPTPKLILSGPTSKLSPQLREQIAAAKEQLLEDLAVQAAVIADIEQRIAAALTHYDWEIALVMATKAGAAGTITQEQLDTLRAKADLQAKKLPTNWDDGSMERYLARWGKPLLIRSKKLGPEGGPKERRKRRAPEPAFTRFGQTEADADTQDTVATDQDDAGNDAEQGELIAIVAREQDIPPKGERDQRQGQEFVYYTTTELAKLNGVTVDQLRSIHQTKKAFDGEVVSSTAAPPTAPQPQEETHGQE
jgi:hypothetical protein